MKNQFTINNVTEDIHDKRIGQVIFDDENKTLVVNSSGDLEWKKLKPSSIDSTGYSVGQVLTPNPMGEASWIDMQGSYVCSTGASSGQVLTADGNGNATWQDAGGGGTQLYLHKLTIVNDGSNFYVNVICKKSNAFVTTDEFVNYYRTFSNICIIDLAQDPTGDICRNCGAHSYAPGDMTIVEANDNNINIDSFSSLGSDNVIEL